MFARRQFLVLGGLGALGLAWGARAAEPTATVQLPAYPPAGPSAADYQAQARRLAELAAEAARQRPNSVLNFTPESLRIVDDMLAEAAAHAPPLTDERKREVVQAFGCYVLEVARREFGGAYQWSDGDRGPMLVVGDPDFQISLVTWPRIAKRLGGDPAASLSAVYQGFADRARAAAPGDKAAFG
ncbi:hypothetical protein ACO2Q3_12395 [Caulobacter sp. KR2-114]|uniref:hypothetical protein n=1 Tax=Caulobacter sp. KR2-114 TaxID=3400912 RepID=UPI003C03FBD7